MNFWQLMIKKDNLIIDVIGKVLTIRSRFNFKEQKLLISTKPDIPLGKGKDLYLILNGPSLKKQDLALLKGKTLMFVNRGFKHPLYKLLKPDFHVFVDNKLLSGEWDMVWLDEIVRLNPNITFLMPVSWAFHDKVKPYIKKGYNFQWLASGSKVLCLGVSGACFKFAIAQQFKTIYFTGFDANGIAYELIKSSNSHFYGVSEDNNTKSTKNYVMDLYMHSRHLSDLRSFAQKCKKRNINIINLTDGGLLDMFEVQDFTGTLNR